MRNEREDLRELAADYAIRVGKRLSGREIEPHPFVGMFAVEHDEAGERTRSGRIDSVVGESAMVEFFSALDGNPTSIQPVGLADLTSGRWKLYRSYRRFREEGALYWERYWNRRLDRRPMSSHEVIRQMWAMEVFWCCPGLSGKAQDRLVSRIMDGEDPLEVMADGR